MATSPVTSALVEEVAVIMYSTDWVEFASCRTADPRLFDAPARVRAADRVVINAVIARFCERCPVRGDCLRDAQRHKAAGVVRGGRLMLVRPDRTAKRSQAVAAD
jgi:hypothetical protein